MSVTDDDGVAGPLTIIDNIDAGFTVQGTWLTYSGGFGGTLRYVPPDAGTAGDVATWSFGGLASGSYEVFATWTPNSKRATNAAYTLLDGSTAAGSASVNQRNAPDDLIASGAAWESLGVVTIDGSTLNVRLSGLGNGSIVADAVRIQPAGGGSLSASGVAGVTSIAAVEGSSQGTRAGARTSGRAAWALAVGDWLGGDTDRDSRVLRRRAMTDLAVWTLRHGAEVLDAMALAGRR